MKVAERIRALREDNDKQQNEIANILKTSQSYYSKYENGVRPLPAAHIYTLAQYYNVSADYILGLIDEPKPLKEGRR